MSVDTIRFHLFAVIFWIFSSHAATNLNSTASLTQVINLIEVKLTNTEVNDTNSLRIHFQQISETLNSLNPFLSFDSISPGEIDAFSKKLKTIKASVKQLTHVVAEQAVDLDSRDQLADDAKSVLTAIRVFEDRVLESKFFKSNMAKANFKAMAPFKGFHKLEQVQNGEEFSISDLRAGDVIVSRSPMLLSSMIARMTDAPMSFSHMGIIVVDPKDGKKYVIDANLNVGFQKILLDEDFYKNQVRLAVFRSTNGVLGVKAAEYGHHAYDSNLRKGTPLEYDITMSLEHNCKYYCSKFISWVYNSTSDKNLIPQYPSRLQGNNKYFASALGIPPSAQYTFAPSDIELDSMFELIYEYRNPGMTAGARLEELVVDKVLYWIRAEGLELNPSAFIERGAKIALGVYKVPALRRLLKSLNMHLNPSLDPKFLSVGYTMQSLVGNLSSQVEKKIKKNAAGAHLSPSEIYQMIEDVRRENPKIASVLRPRKQNSCLGFYTSYSVR